MFGSQALETAIGLVLLLFVLAVAVSAVTEAISQGLQKRARDLEKTIGRMLSGAQPDPTGKPFARFWGGVRRLVGRPATAPSGLPEEIDRRLRVGVARGSKGYLSAKSFADAAVELAATGAASGTFPTGTEALVSRMKQLAAQARGDLTQVKAGLEGWFDDAMVAAADAYKRWTTVVVLLTGLVLAVLTNASVIDVAKDLWTSSATRAAVVEAADAAVAQGQSGTCADKTGVEGVACSVEQTSNLDLPLGWADDRLWGAEATDGEKVGWWASHVFGVGADRVSVDDGRAVLVRRAVKADGAACDVQQTGFGGGRPRVGDHAGRRRGRDRSTPRSTDAGGGGGRGRVGSHRGTGAGGPSGAPRTWGTVGGEHVPGKCPRCREHPGALSKGRRSLLAGRDGTERDDGSVTRMATLLGVTVDGQAPTQSAWRGPRVQAAASPRTW